VFKLLDTIYDVQFTKRFKKTFKKSLRRGKDEKKFLEVLKFIANGEELPEKYKNHALNDNKEYKNCFECHIEPDWLLIYKIQDDKLLLLLFATGSHSDLF
jgi:mRNA interferase YafQ